MACERSGVADFLLKTLPNEGESIAVKYLPHVPRWSRMVGEIKLASS